MLKKQGMIGDGELDAVAGGFREDAHGLPTTGKEIVCPSCHTNNPNDFALAVYTRHIIVNGTPSDVVEYKCNRCNRAFITDGVRAVDKQQFINECTRKGYTVSGL